MNPDQVINKKFQKPAGLTKILRSGKMISMLCIAFSVERIVVAATYVL
jgi:hypothetical protein